MNEKKVEVAQNETLDIRTGVKAGDGPVIGSGGGIGPTGGGDGKQGGSGG
jgi:hypothetical protein